MPLIEGLTALGRQVISFDPPASGRSNRPMRLSMSEMHDCADEALAVCGISGPVDAVGHSMGGLAVLAYAIERPDRVRRLVLIGTGTGGRAYMTAPGALWNRSHPQFWRLAALGILQMVWRRRAPEKILNDFIHRQSFVDQRWAGSTTSGSGRLAAASGRPHRMARDREPAGLRPPPRQHPDPDPDPVRPSRPPVPARLFRGAGRGHPRLAGGLVRAERPFPVHRGVGGLLAGRRQLPGSSMRARFVIHDPMGSRAAAPIRMKGGR